MKINKFFIENSGSFMNENIYMSGDFAEKFCKLIINKFIFLYLLIIVTPSLFFMTKISNFILKIPFFKMLSGIYVVFIFLVFSPILRKIYLNLVMNQPIKLSISAKSLAKLILVQVIKLLFSAFFVIGGFAFLRLFQSFPNARLLLVVSLIAFLFYIAMRSYFVIEFVLAKNLTIHESFQQSWNLTQNNFWRTSLYVLIVSIIASVLSYVFLLSIPFVAIVDSIMFSNLLNENRTRNKFLSYPKNLSQNSVHF